MLQVSGNTQSPPQYVVSIDTPLTTLSVEACFPSGQVPTYLWARSDRAPEVLKQARFGDRTLKPRRSRLYLRGSSESCVSYVSDLSAISSESGNRSASRVGRDLLTNSGLWLWRPANAGNFVLRFELPQGASVSAPWDNVGPTGDTTFLVTPTMEDWSDYVAFGYFDVLPVNVPGSTFRLAVLDGEPAASLTDVQTWVREAGLAVASVTGQFPLPGPQVLVVPIAQGSGPVPWAQVKRGGGSAAHFFINQEKSLNRFLGDWTPSHEFSHMLHPYLGDGGRWVSEGLASYYQNVSRARSGQLSQRQAWERLHAGFERGRKASTRQPLADLIRTGAGRYNFMRIYWSGAAMALNVDVALRQRSGGKQTLDTVLADFQKCCLPSTRSWRPREYMQQLDKLAGGNLFETQYDAVRHYRGFPPLEDTFAALALEERWGRLQYQRAPDDAVALRDAIMASTRSANSAVGN